MVGKGNEAMSHNILEHIWSSQVELSDISRGSPVAHMLSSLLTVPTLCFTTRYNPSETTAFACVAGAEVMPGATLADVLCEEFDIDVSDETVIYFEAESIRDAKDYSADMVGKLIGNILVSLASEDPEKAQCRVPTDKGAISRHGTVHAGWTGEAMVQ